MAQEHRRRKRQLASIACITGTYYFETYMNKSTQRTVELSGIDWVMRTLNNSRSCYDMFRMSREMFYRLHNLLVTSYGLKSSCKMSSIEGLAMFLMDGWCPSRLDKQKIVLRGQSRQSVGNLMKYCRVFTGCKQMLSNQMILNLERFTLGWKDLDFILFLIIVLEP